MREALQTIYFGKTKSVVNGMYQAVGQETVKKQLQAELMQMRRDGKSMDDAFKECERLTGDTNFLYLVSLYHNKNRLKVYTVHALNARRLEGEEVYSRIDDEEPWW